MKDVFIVLPGFNEENHVFKTIKAIKDEGFSNIVFVDDGSTDNSSKKALLAGATVLTHKINLGKGCAVRTGCDYAVDNGAKYIVLMDSDGQHAAEDIKKLLKKIQGKDIVFGYRLFHKKMPFLKRFGNSFLSTTSSFLFGLKLKDTQSGFRCFTGNAYKKIKWYSSGYGMESEMIARVSKNNLSFDEVLVKTIYHDAHKGTTPIDGVKVLFNMIRFKFFS